MPLNDLVLYKYSADLIFLTFNISCVGDFTVKVYPSDFSAMLLGPWTSQDFISFLPLVSYAEESFTHLIDWHIWFSGYITWTLEYSANLILLVFGITCGGESFTYQGLHIWFLIFRLYYLDLRVLRESHPFCLEYLMRGRVLPIKTCT